MPGNSLEEARFDHVSDTGELVFVSGAGKFAVKIDEALERAILEAKQIRSEVQEEQKTRIPPTLPISQIQSLIRAGADPARVAERYSLSEALVRRFSASVETEKAICDRAVSRRSSAEGKPRTHAFRTDRTHFCGSAGALGRCDLEGHQTWLGALENQRSVRLLRSQCLRGMVVEHARQCRKLPEFRSTKTHWRTGHVERRTRRETRR